MKRLESLGVLLLMLAGGCGPVEEPGSSTGEPGSGTLQAVVEDENGLAFNGLAFNGLAFNGLSSSSFSSWFQQHPAESDLFMKYLIRCAVPNGQTRTYSNGTSTYTWPGLMGLAPGWSSGLPATLAEQQVVTACLGALVNKYGRTVTVSLQGANAQGQRIPTTASELSSFPMREGCFFGNLFNGEGVFVGNDQGMLSESQSSLRACALSGINECPPLIHIGSCHTSCEHDSTGTYFTRCTRNGVTYQPLTTRLRPQELFSCGDGICQLTESCGNGTSADNCERDCGTCG